MRRFLKYTIPKDFRLSSRLPALASEFSTFCQLSANQAPGRAFDLLAGLGAEEVMRPEPGKNFEALARFLDEKKDWAFGHFSYDLKNEIEALSSSHPDGVGFPLIGFFRPRFVLLLSGDDLQIGHLPGDEKNAAELFGRLLALPVLGKNAGDRVPASRVSKADYLRAAEALRKHILRGDIYEVNYCIEFFAENCNLDPAAVFRALDEVSQAPFSALYRRDEHWLLSASPERFLKKEGAQLISQPIKGTARRGKTIEEDEQIKARLQHDPKERSENVMIVDLVRNDLSQAARRGSVRVEELFGIYTFRQVHQMISTVRAELREDLHAVEAIRRTFPMGSMTGAPKVRAMQLIEQYEATRRGLYSGAVGYFTPQGDFDLNVVIRSIQYNAAKKYVSFMAGSAITQGSDPEREYDECLLKAKAMLEVLSPIPYF